MILMMHLKHFGKPQNLANLTQSCRMMMVPSLGTMKSAVSQGLPIMSRCLLTDEVCIPLILSSHCLKLPSPGAWVALMFCFLEEN